MKKIILTLMLIATLFITVACAKEEGDKEKGKTEIVIGAAASLENVFTKELIPEFEKEHKNVKVLGTYDASGKLQTQIEEGAEIDVFFSAATKQMNELESQKLIDKDTVVDLIQNEIVLIRGKESKEKDVKTYKDVTKASNIAMGDPKSVPAGQYAKESFENLNIWEDIEKKEVSYGTNVTEVLNWVAEGSAQVGIVYRSDAISMKDKVIIIATAPKDSVSKCVYPIGVVTSSKEKEVAKEFIDFLKSEKAMKILEKYGFKSNV